MMNTELNNTISKIVEINRWLSEFWSNSHGWAPEEAAILMSKSRLDRQASLSKCLRIWDSTIHLSNGDGVLILAWANLGSLIEGTLKLFLAAYYDDYKNDIEAYKNKKSGNLIDPDQLGLEKLRVFFNKRGLWDKEWSEYTLKVQQYRNAIHAFKDRNIGTYREYKECVITYLKMIEQFNLNLPYPDELYIPER